MSISLIKDIVVDKRQQRMNQIEVDGEKAVLTLAWRQNGDADCFQVVAESSLDLDILGSCGARIIDA